VLADDSGPGQPFSIAREPLAQGFKAVRGSDRDAFLVVANHLKSKGADADALFSDCPGGDAENSDPALDQGAFNCTRVHQVKDMWAWARQQAGALGTDKMFLVGDFNAYDHEDPIEYLRGQGLTDLAGRFDPSHSSYSYDGLEGSLDHVLATPAALKLVTGATIWQIDAQESVAFAYSRDNYNVTQLYDGTDPFATSDHDPEVVGLALPRHGGDHGRR
jgi:predicted extracellular nuclease